MASSIVYTNNGGMNTVKCVSKNNRQKYLQVSMCTKFYIELSVFPVLRQYYWNIQKTNFRHWRFEKKEKKK